MIYYGCDIPEELYYHLEYDTWVRFEDDGQATLGMTDVAQTASGKLLQIRFKAVGSKIKAGRSGATIESAKWVGPFRLPFEAEVVATNEASFKKDLLIANRDPYGQGWLLKVRPLQPDIARQDLLSGPEAAPYFQQRIEEHNIRCFRCVDEPRPSE